MLPFEQYLRDAAATGQVVNTMFEERLFELVGVLHRISAALTSADVAHELVGGLAVFVHVEEVDPSQSMLTRDVDVMIRREDLERVKEVAARHGFRYRHAASLDMLLYGDNDSARNAVHLLFAGEKVRPTQATANPEIRPEVKQILGAEVRVIPVSDLLRMKLSSFRLKDQVHVQVMQASGLITAEVEGQLPSELQARLAQVRSAD